MLSRSSTDTYTAVSLPRVHARFLKDGNVFAHRDVKNKKVHGETFIHDVKSGIIKATFWEGHEEGAIICVRSCWDRCIEYAKMWA